MLAEFFARAGGVEIAERDEVQPVNPLIPQQRLLEHQLGFAVGIDRALRQVFRHRHAVRRAVGGAGGAEDEFFHAAFHGGVGKLERVDEVVVEILFRIRHGFADERERGEMQNRLRLHRLDGGENVTVRLRFSKNEFRARVHRRAMAFREVVINRYLMSGVEEFFRANGSDITGAAGDKNIHADSVENFRAGESSKRKNPAEGQPGETFFSNHRPARHLGEEPGDFDPIHDPANETRPANRRFHREWE